MSQNNEQIKQAHDVIYSAVYAKSLATKEQMEQLKLYIMKFFFASKTGVFFDSGLEYVLYKELGEVKKLIANDLIVYDGKNELFNARKFLESTEFKARQYEPMIDFTKDKVIIENTIIKGVSIPKHKLNMAKPFGNLDLKKEIDRNIHGAGLKKIYDHILNIWCSKNAELNEYLLNFFACTFGGRKLRKCLYSQTNLERCGRGTILNFINAILGSAMFKTSSIETITKYTKPLEGCLFVNFDELPVGSDNFKTVNDSLKTLSTEPTFLLS